MSATQENRYPSSIHEVIEAARRHGLRLDEASAKASDAGLDFFAVFARDTEGREWVVRSARRDEVVERAKHEARVLQFVKSRLPVSVPDWQIHTENLVAYPKLAGVPAAEVDPEAKAYVWHVNPQAPAQALIQTTAEALAKLHSIDHKEIADAGFPVLDVSGVRKLLASQMDQVRRELGVPDAMWGRWQTWLANESLWPRSTAFVHGDFHVGHMLVDTNERLVGVLDWTEGGVGDPAVDLAIFQMVFGNEIFGKLLKAYADAGGVVWPQLNEHVAETVAAFPAKIGIFALASGQDEHIAMAKDALKAT